MMDRQYPEVTRITVVGEHGAVFERYNLFVNGAEIHLQDDGRTLKVFPMQGIVVGAWGYDPETHSPIHLPSYNLGRTRA